MRVFISHASEDKERFVLDFATKLRAKGVDAWVDKWEMYPGDSLVNKIFEEGIKDAKAIIIILSKYSVDKPWVKEEINASFVKRVNQGSKLVPVIIDDCSIPVCLQSTVWVKIKDINNYDSDLERIVMSIYGQQDKPPIGNPPFYAQTIIDIVPNLTKVDSLVLKISCEKAIELGHPGIDTESIWKRVESLNVPIEEFRETIEILDEKGYIKAMKVIGGEIPHFLITTFGFEEYSRVYMEDYDSIFESAAFQIVNQDNKHNTSISKSLNQPQRVIDHILDVLEAKGLIKLVKSIGGGISIYYISPELKRILKTR